MSSFTGVFLRFALLGIALCVIGGCGLFGERGKFRDRESDYLKANTMPPLVLPPGLDDESIEDIYYVPPIDPNARAASKFVVPRPEPLVAGDFDDIVKIQSLGQDQWILVRLLPGQVWPRVKDFLLGRRLGVALEDGSDGIIQSPWVRNPQAAFNEIYRFHLAQGVQSRTTEIYRAQAQQRAGEAETRAVSARYSDLSRGDGWPELSDDRQRERLMLQQFADYLARTADVNTPVSLVAQGIDTSRRLYTVPGDKPLIRVNLGIERAWASLALALDKADFEVLEENRDQGAYTVSPPLLSGEEGGKGNWFTRLFKPSTYKKGESEAGRVDFILEPAGEAGWVEVRVAEPTAAGESQFSAKEKQKMLVLVGSYLS